MQVWKAWTLAVLCILVLVSHLALSPFRRDLPNILEALTLTLLCIIATREAVVAVYAKFGLSEDATTTQAFAALQLALTLLALVGAIGFRLVALRALWWPKVWRATQILVSRLRSKHLGSLEEGRGADHHDIAMERF